MFGFDRRFLSTLLLAACAAQAAPTDSRSLDAIPVHVLSASDLNRARATLAIPVRPGAVRLAVAVPISLGLTDGSWDHQVGQSIWRIRLTSPGATLLIAYFDRFDLPQGASLRLLDTDGSTSQGPYTSSDRNADGGLWTALMPGDDLLIELRVPTSNLHAVDIRLGALGHGEYALQSRGPAMKSGNCNVDVACPQGNEWRDPIRSAVRLQIPTGDGDVTLCSGELINNSSQDGTPYVLTATHCGITEQAAQGIVTYFNFESTACGGVPNGTMEQNQSGATRVFADAQSDHTIIRLLSPPRPEFNAYLSGFDAHSTPESGVSIHHPGGGEKRISAFSTPASKVDDVCLGDSLPDGCSVTRIDTFRVTWDSGVTEAGSSGAGLWNQDRRLVGVLSGGFSSCANPGGEDYFGRLDAAWEIGAGAILDPVGQGLTRVISGKNLNGTPPPIGGGSRGGGGGSLGYASVVLFGFSLLGAVRKPRRLIADKGKVPTSKKGRAGRLE